MLSSGKNNPSEKACEFSQSETHPQSREFIALVSLLLLLIFFGLLRLAWPGDASFVGDEPILINMALKANNSGELPSYGLKGTRNIHYGPFPVWLYMIFLWLTRDLIAVVVIRVLLVTTVTSLAIVWLARTCRHLWPLAGAAALLSPYLWFYSRNLWDNSFSIPLTALAFAAYLAFCHRRQWWTLALTFLCLTFLFLTHLMCLPVIAVFILHFLFFHRAWWRKHWWAPLLFLTIASLISWPYLNYLFHASIEPPPPGLSPQAGVFSLLGARFFSAYGLDYLLGRGWEHSRSFPGSVNLMVAIFGRFTGIALLVTWYGMIYCAARVVMRINKREEHDIRFHGCLISLAVVSCQSIFNLMSQTYGYPHYYNATWIYSFFFFWSAISLIQSQKWQKLIFGSYSLAMLAVMAFAVTNIHLLGGHRDGYGPTLANQIQVAIELNRYDPQSCIDTTVKQIEHFPHAIKTLQKLYAEPSASVRPKRKLFIRYANTNPESGMIEVVVVK
jgi:hypothetical protein